MSNGILETFIREITALNGNIQLLNETIRVARNADPRTGVPNETKGSVIDISDTEEEAIPTLNGEEIISREELEESKAELEKSKKEEFDTDEPIIAGKNTWLLMADDSVYFVAKGDEMPDESDIEKRITKKEYDAAMAEQSKGFANDDEGESFEDDDEFGDEDPEDDDVISFEHFKNIFKLFGSNGNGARAKSVLSKCSSTGSDKLSAMAEDPEGRTKAIEMLKTKWKAYDKAAKKVGYVE